MNREELREKKIITKIIEDCLECPHYGERGSYCLLVEGDNRGHRTTDKYPFPDWCPLTSDEYNKPSEGDLISDEEIFHELREMPRRYPKETKVNLLMRQIKTCLRTQRQHMKNNGWVKLADMSYEEKYKLLCDLEDWHLEEKIKPLLEDDAQG